jgi:hypothetical protein
MGQPAEVTTESTGCHVDSVKAVFLTPHNTRLLLGVKGGRRDLNQLLHSCFEIVSGLEMLDTNNSKA